MATIDARLTAAENQMQGQLAPSPDCWDWAGVSTPELLRYRDLLVKCGEDIDQLPDAERAEAEQIQAKVKLKGTP